MLHLVTHGHDDAAATSPTSTAVLTRPRSGVDLRVDYAAGCATAEIAQQRRTGRSGAAAARPRHRRRVSRDRAARRFYSRCEVDLRVDDGASLAAVKALVWFW